MLSWNNKSKSCTYFISWGSAKHIWMLCIGKWQESVVLSFSEVGSLNCEDDQKSFPVHHVKMYLFFILLFHLLILFHFPAYVCMYVIQNDFLKSILRGWIIIICLSIQTSMFVWLVCVFNGPSIVTGLFRYNLSWLYLHFVLLKS